MIGDREKGIHAIFFIQQTLLQLYFEGTSVLYAQYLDYVSYHNQSLTHSHM